MSSKGVQLIAKERKEQILKHKRTVEQDRELNSKHQLSVAASCLLFDYDIEGDKISRAREMRILTLPNNWDKSIWKKMASKSYKSRLIIAGALIAAEIDRISK